MSIIDFPIERLNEFLNDYSFEITKPFGPNVDIEGKLKVKVKLTGIKPMISIGEWKDFIEYTLTLEDADDQHIKGIMGYMFAAAKTHDYVISNTDTKFYTITSQVNHLLSNFLKYWGIENYVTCTRIVDEMTNIDPKYMIESVITESKYDSVIRKLVQDVLGVFKHQKEGDFTLPEDISDNMTYDFSQFNNDFTINVHLSQDENVETVDVDGEYYTDEDTIEIYIVSNPNLDRELLEELHFELNELIRHEMEHMIQHERGDEFPKEETKKPLKYYTQKHELEAQIAGFKRRAQKERKPLEDVIRSWFRKNQLKHRLSPKNVEVVINKILELA
jgi:hypothetical protein